MIFLCVWLLVGGVVGGMVLCFHSNPLGSAALFAFAFLIGNQRVRGTQLITHLTDSNNIQGQEGKTRVSFDQKLFWTNWTDTEVHDEPSKAERNYRLSFFWHVDFIRQVWQFSYKLKKHTYVYCSQKLKWQKHIHK